MATETVASTDELLEKKVDEEANGLKSVSLSNEHEGKHDKDEDAQGSAAPFFKTEGEAKGDENKDEPAVVVVENIIGSLSSKASFADNLKEEKELIHDSQTISVTEPAPAPDEAKSQSKEPPPTEPTESTETSDEKQPKTVEIIEELSNTAEANLLKESEVNVVKEAEYLETSSQKVDKHEALVTEVQENSEVPEKESQDKAQEAEKLNKVVVSDDPSAETDEKPYVAKESTEPIAQQVHENSVEQEKESQEKIQEVEQPSKVAIPDTSAETNEIPSDVVENRELVVPGVQEKSEEPGKESQEKPQEVEQPNTFVVSDPSDETNEKLSDAIDKSDPAVTEVQETSEEPKKEPQGKTQDAEQPNTVEVSDPSAETNEKPTDAKEMLEAIVTEVNEKSEKSQEAEQSNIVAVSDSSVETREKLSDATEKIEPIVTEVHEKSEETEKESQENPQVAEQPNITAVSDSSVETNEKLSDATEKPEPIVTEVHEKSEETNKESEEKPQDAEQPKTVAIPDHSAETNEEKLSDVMEKNTREPTSLKVEKTDAQVSLDEETQATTANLVESSHAVAEMVVEGDGKKESSCTEEIKSVSKEVVDVLKDPEQAFIKHEAKTDLKQETEYFAPISIEEKVAANDDNKQQGTPVAAEGSSREAEVEIKKDVAMTATTEAADNEKRGHPETNVEEIRETLASKLEEKEEGSVKTCVDTLEKVQDEAEPPTKESDASKDLPPKETPAKTTQKQSNGIISKVKKSLIKAKKAITGKSPTTSKTISSQAKGDIIVK